MSAFDKYASSYDEDFSSSSIGKLQRATVHHYLKNIELIETTILEVGGGTGEDALFFAQQKALVHFTEPSKGMMEVAQSKFTDLPQISTEQIAAQDISQQILNKKFIYSGFGALNCLSPHEFNVFIDKIDQLAEPNSNIVLVVMGRKCIWERVYFSFKGKKTEASRRQTKIAIMANAGQGQIATWYYSPQEIINYFSPNFEVVTIKPVGLWVPPSYLQPFFDKHPLLLKGLGFLDKVFEHFSFLANYADHFLIHLRKKRQAERH